MQVTKVTVDRLYNLGNFEHVKFSVSVDVREGESASTALVGLEKIMAALSPERNWGVNSRAELEREAHRIKALLDSLAVKGPEEFKVREGFFEGTPLEYIERLAKSHAENVAKREAHEKRAITARKMLDDLGGAAVWKDAKLEWEYDEEEL